MENIPIEKKKPKKKKKKDILSLPEAKKIMPIDLSDLELNGREFRYIAAYCTNGFNQRKAYYEAGYKGKTNAIADSRASEIMGRDRIQEAIKRFMEVIIKPYRERLEVLLLDTYYKRAFYKITSFFNEDGRIKELDEIKEEDVIVIDGVEESFYGKNETRLVKYKLADRSEALRILWDYVFNIYCKEGGSSLPEESRKRIEDIFNRKNDPTPEGRKMIAFHNKGGK